MDCSDQVATDEQTENELKVDVISNAAAGHVGHSTKDCHILKNKVQELVNQKLICFTPANTIKDKFEYKRHPLQVPVFASIVHPATQYQGLCFEQFCINLTNEKLQQHFNQHVFKMEQEEYTKEEIDWSYIEFVDNQDVLDLIEKKPGGVIALLDEACMFPRSTHETFAEKLYQTLKDNKRFSKPKLSRTDFTINHYAGDVTYQTDLFLDKNKDYVVPEHAALLCASKCSFVSGLFPPLHEESTKSTKFSSIATQFKQQLQSLLETLSATEPHYIRCVKPNNLLKPGIFENNDVLQQLRCGGVMEAIKISCAGYPTRKNFDEFVQRFSIMEPKVLKSCPDEMTACKRLLDKANLKDYQIGKTKVFLRAGQMAELDACRAEVLGRSAIVIQKKARTYICEKQYKLLRFSAIELQRAIKGINYLNPF
ncbi:hypothetical protein KIW84_015587 [Lathyrus oleraceus]|uniref:Myosin motor domain-containing protein n=1 Tax=Pisum sativum TaxID=3888 RepID=A0A9D5H0R9_PEA|nr:hypothetical protein KIW84_015587 [Pisum sativum]